MAAPLKDLLDAALVREIARELRSVHRAFDLEAFVARSTRGLDRLELTARAAHIADAFHEFLPRPFARAAAVMEAALGPEIPATGENGLAPLRYLPHVSYVQKYGLDDYDAAIRLQAELTKRFSAEYSIRAFLSHHPERTYRQMLAWARDENPHLRRLASEGVRPRLPWALRLRVYQEDPGPVLALLEILKDDPVRYVQRSVANNLNDIAKDHPALVVETCRRWSKNAAPGRTWVVGHALRSLVKAGNQEAISILGGADRPRVAIENIRITPKRARLGDKVRLSFELRSTARSAQRLIVDYVVHFVKANGKTSPKVFKLRTLTLERGKTVTLSATFSLVEMTTRKHYAGKHRIEAVVNGARQELGAVAVTP